MCDISITVATVGLGVVALGDVDIAEHTISFKPPRLCTFVHKHCILQEK